MNVNIALKVKTKELLENKENAEKGLAEMLNFVGKNPERYKIISNDCKYSDFGYCALRVGLELIVEPFEENKKCIYCGQICKNGKRPKL